MTADLPERPKFDSLDEPLLDGALAFLDLAYESAESPSRVVEALSRLADLIRAPSVLLFSGEGSDRRLVAAAHATPRLAAKEEAFQLRSDRLRTIPLAGGLELVVDPSALDPARKVLLLRLAPHLARALRLGDHSRQEEHEAQLAARLDRAALAVVLVDSAGQVVMVNRGARSLLAAASSLEIEAHRLAPRHGVSRLLYETVIERVTAPAEPDRLVRGGRLSLADTQWGRVDLLVAPFSTRLAASGRNGGEVSAAVLLSACGVSPTPEARLSQSCGLSPEEARVAVDLITGRPRDDESGRAAAEETIRSIYRKLGTTRQSDLLRLILRPAGVVFESAPANERSI